MARPADPVLQQIHQLDRGSPDFRDQLNAVFRGRDYEDHKKGLVKSDLVWFVDYLDGVCRHAQLPLPTPHSARIVGS